MDCFAEDVSEDGLTRKVWEFNLNGHYLVMRRYAEETRKTRRHKWRGPQWDVWDERSYHSKLPRPETIPPEMVMQAISKMTFQVAIGFSRPEDVIGQARIQARTVKITQNGGTN